MNKEYEEYLKKFNENKEKLKKPIQIDNNVNEIDISVNKKEKPKKDIVNKTKVKNISVNKKGRRLKYGSKTKLLAIRVPEEKHEALLNLVKDNL